MLMTNIDFKGIWLKPTTLGKDVDAILDSGCSDNNIMGKNMAEELNLKVDWGDKVVKTIGDENVKISKKFDLTLNIHGCEQTLKFVV